jgi:23S rRNA (cytidine2498-2'-O)-methyltransferase
VKTPALLLVTKAEFTEGLAEEICCRTGMDAERIVRIADGLLALPYPGAAGLPAALSEPLVFERQRLCGAVRLESEALKPLAREIFRRLMPPVVQSEGPWTAHVFAVDPTGAESASGRARSLERVLQEFCRERFTRVARRYVAPEQVAWPDSPALVLSLAVTAQGTWGSVMPAAALTDPRPGGIHRMAFDPAAPARSYMKVEEAFDLLGEKPASGQSVVDLGASPGGWSYAFLKRGCRVTAVDNGPMLIRDPERGGGTLTHVREDGVVFTPLPRTVPVDWLVSDMLVSTGKNIGMLRRWFEGRWMRRFVVNVKLPQVELYPSLRPLEDYLRTIPGIAFRVRHLYHDRREVTLFGRLSADRA